MAELAKSHEAAPLRKREREALRGGASRLREIAAGASAQPDRSGRAAPLKTWSA
jgi:hypothetical protein